MARYDIGRIKVLYRGEYNADTPYEMLDCVMYNSDIYMYTAFNASKGTTPDTTSHWIKITTDLIADREKKALWLYNSIFYDIVGPNASHMNDAVQIIGATASQMKQEE